MFLFWKNLFLHFFFNYLFVQNCFFLDRCPFVLFLLAITFSVLQLTDSEYPFGIFKLFLLRLFPQFSFNFFKNFIHERSFFLNNFLPMKDFFIYIFFCLLIFVAMKEKKFPRKDNFLFSPTSYNYDLFRFIFLTSCYHCLSIHQIMLLLIM